MTGYGRNARQIAGGRVTVELRSTNHRYLDIDQRLPNGFATLQGRIAELIRGRVGRGRVDVVVLIQILLDLPVEGQVDALPRMD